MPRRNKTGRRRQSNNNQWIWCTSSVHLAPGKSSTIKASAYAALKARNFRPVKISIQSTCDEMPIGMQVTLYNNIGYEARTYGPFLQTPGALKHYNLRWPNGEWWNASTENVLFEMHCICLTNLKQQANAEGLFIVRVKVILSDYTFGTTCPTYALPSSSYFVTPHRSLPHVPTVDSDQEESDGSFTS